MLTGWHKNDKKTTAMYTMHRKYTEGHSMMKNRQTKHK